jgi:hypothetical protein
MSLFYRYPLKVLNNRRLKPWGNRGAQNSDDSQVMKTSGAIARLKEAHTGMIYGKIGTTELLALEFSERFFQPSWPSGLSWQRQAERLYLDSGVFPPEREQFHQFLETYRKSVGALDGIVLWQEAAFLRAYERSLTDSLCPRAIRLSHQVLSPFSVLPEICSLRWLVVSPFIRTMKMQESRLSEVHFFYPWHRQLKQVAGRPVYLRCPQFSYMEKSPYRNWTEGVEKLTEQALQLDFDLALVGAGAWSLPLLANLKRAGKKGIHLGGTTQLVFGIKGRRWDQKGWNMPYNHFWVRPLPEETPEGHMRKEDGCYW